MIRPAWQVFAAAALTVFVASRASAATGAPSQGDSDEEILRRIELKVGRDSAAAVAAVRALLKTPVSVEVPPSIPFECTADRDLFNSRAVQSYVTAASAPELQAMTKLLEIQRAAQLLGIGGDTYNFEVWLLRRQIRKVQDLLRAHKGKPEKVAPILAFAVEVNRQVQLIGGAEREEQQLLAPVGDFVAATIDSLLRELVSKHDYRRATTLIRVARWARLLSSSGSSAGAEEAMEAALSFRVRIAFTFKTTGENGHVEDWTLEAEVPVTGAFDDVTNKEILKGSGEGKYVSYVNHDANPRTRATMTAKGFPLDVRIEEFDACAGMAMVGVSRFFADAERYLAPVDQGEPAELPMAKTGWELLFGDRNERGFYWFPVSVRNLNPTAVDSTRDQTMNTFDGHVSAQLIHTPRSAKK